MHNTPNQKNPPDLFTYQTSISISISVFIFIRTTTTAVVVAIILHYSQNPSWMKTSCNYRAQIWMIASSEQDIWVPMARTEIERWNKTQSNRSQCCSRLWEHFILDISINCNLPSDLIRRTQIQNTEITQVRCADSWKNRAKFTGHTAPNNKRYSSTFRCDEINARKKAQQFLVNPLYHCIISNENQSKIRTQTHIYNSIDVFFLAVDWIDYINVMKWWLRVLRFFVCFSPCCLFYIHICYRFR